MISRPWAFWRRIEYLTGLFVVFILIGTGVYFAYFNAPPTCMDGRQNGDERGVDCGGICTRICALDVLPIVVQWAESFRIVDGQYNAVAYVQNKNIGIGSPEVAYTITLFDESGVITERSGTTVLPPDSVYPIFEGRIDTGTRTPTRTEITFEGSEIWLPTLSGREQFTVESRALTRADENPRLDVRLTNTSLSTAEDVEIVATIFDAGKHPLTASRTIVQSFPGRSTQDVVFTWPQPIAKTVRSCEVPTDVILAVDLSGSMNDEGGTPAQPISAVLAAAEAFTARLGAYDQIGVVTYATDASTPQVLTRDTAAAKKIVASRTITPEAEVGSTNTGDAITAAYTELNSARHNLDARKVLVLLTDGKANAPEDSPEQYALAAAQKLKDTDTTIYTIGLGTNINEAFLKNIASGEDHYFKALSKDTIDSIYQSITSSICESGPAVIEVIPKTAASFAPIQ
ncbi:hypothetical protein COU16_01420 [Candidatus Kaiserbacteria bacterium CG10_big_fil_rev_8_21_14_0_10_47_16]|uniref:VWFA domain-containing protein n=1 Tax=Candidatus Kaiserbacteria bacterium CG10_big_fil_rev_8_21_14_0_10_47_16 TaxID=1974608 RepID=A0A2H0UE98_9BACT|nr:MAG: hypothetical protein COU16_01420 [Candidatus Kaiserbacteria bacterium CG10_big_fil_rev_8_21_14_0_10_47_16]